MSVTSPGVCPEVLFDCNAVGLSSDSLRWYFDDDLFAVYNLDENDQYPLVLNPRNVTYSTLVGGVDIQILEATPNENNANIVRYRSSLIFSNISQLQVAGISEISCGPRSEEERGYANIEFNSSQGWCTFSNSPLKGCLNSVD